MPGSGSGKRNPYPGTQLNPDQSATPEIGSRVPVLPGSNPGTGVGQQSDAVDVVLMAIVDTQTLP
jgi:hypothetical protein